MITGNLIFVLLFGPLVSYARDTIEPNIPIKPGTEPPPGGNCFDLEVITFAWKGCSLNVAISNVGWLAAPAPIGVDLGPSGIFGDPFQWHMTNIPPQSSVWVPFGVIVSSQPQIIATVDPFNVLEECIEENNSLQIQVPEGCIGEPTSPPVPGGKKCYDLEVTTFAWGDDCSLNVVVSNIGVVTAPAPIGAGLGPSGTIIGDPFQWHMTNMLPQTSVWVPFGVIISSQPHIIATADPFNLLEECNEENNSLEIEVPAQCIDFEPDECWIVLVTGQDGGLRSINTQTLETEVTLVNYGEDEYPSAIGFEGPSLWGYSAGVVNEYSLQDGAVLSAMPGPFVSWVAGMGTHPINFRLVMDRFIGTSIVLVDTGTGNLDEIATTATTVAVSGDTTSFQGELYASVQGLPDADELVHINVDDGTVSSIGWLPAALVYGLAEVGAPDGGGTELWAFHSSGDVYSVDPETVDNDGFVASTFVGHLDGTVADAASRPCS